MEQIDRSILDSLVHRGPDDGDIWKDTGKGVTMIHRRLSIVDLSKAGHQPMHSSCGQFVIVYNGEIYNTEEIKREILSIRNIEFKSTTDTEVVLEACALWGVEKTLEKLIGMFALALWDRKNCTFMLARDRIGIKPLYWGRFDQLFLFGSELKALRANTVWEPKINRNAIVNFMRHNYIPAPMTIYHGIFKLQPGCLLTIKAGSEPQIEKYWNLANVVNNDNNRNVDISDTEATNELDMLLRDAVGRRMVADVSLGAFLSGGIDSSTVVALMQEQSSQPVHTFSIGFHESGFNEAEYAAEVAKHLGTNHTELYVTSKEALDTIPMLPDIYDEPFADSSQIPTYLVSALTKQYVTVSLSGDGGDECFAGYNRYFLAERVRRFQQYAPKQFRNLLSLLILSSSPDSLDKLSNVLPYPKKLSQLGDRLHKLAKVMHLEKDDFYRKIISHWDEPEALVCNGKEIKGVVWDPSVMDIVPNYVERMQYLDSLTYLPDDILTKVDRSSMAASLEARVPLLDHRVIEFAWHLPMKHKIRKGQGKWLLRQVLYKYVPKGMVERPKMGFGVPIDKWLRGPLRDWAENLLEEKKMREQGLIHTSMVREKWQEHLSGTRNWQYHLWNVLMFQAWHERWME